MKKTLIMLVFATSLQVQADDALESMRHARSHGVPGLALHYLEQADLAPAEKTAQRITLLVETGRHQEALDAAEAFRFSAPEWAPRQAWLAGARAALALGENQRALTLMARLLWQAELAPDAYKEARFLVIDAVLASGRGQDAYRAMLRYQQEFPPLGRPLVQRFTEGLIGAGLDAEAVTWLPDLDTESPLRMLARMKAGLLTPDDAIAEVRQILDPPPPPPPVKGKKAKSVKATPTVPRPENEQPYWAILMHAGLMAQQTPIAAEAMEKLLDSRPLPAGIWGAKPDVLWESYGTIARQEANAAQLLDGDDRAWFDRAVNLASSRGLAARALFGHLAVAAKDAQVRETARANWLQLMLARRMDRTVLRMLGARLGRDRDGLAQAIAAVLKMLPVDDQLRRRETWFVAGEEAQARSFHDLSATAFLRAAEGSDAMAREARWRAAENLARAGMGQDALVLLKVKNP